MRVRSYSPATVKNRRGPLKRLLAWCNAHGIGSPAGLTRPVLELYQRAVFDLRRRDGAPLATTTQNFILEPVRALLKWLAKNNVIPSNPATELEFPKIGKLLPRSILTSSEAEAIVSQPDTRALLGLRDRAILETLYSSGIRRAELCGLAVHDLDFERGTLMVREGKGRKDRVVPIGERALSWITRYLAEARPQLLVGDDKGALFLTATHGRRIAPNTLSRIALAYRNAAGVTKRGSCHIFRHTMATLMLENGADIRSLQEILGHARLQTTERYTQASIKRLKEVHAKTHPARRLDRRARTHARP